RPGVDIQDYGFVYGFDAVSRAPDEGWSPSRRTEAIAGHCYILRLLEDDDYQHYVKLYVTEVTIDFVMFWWAYQTAPENRDLIPSPGSDDEGINIVKLPCDVGSGGKVKMRKRLMQ
ncbi:MAG: hypothetical protein KAX38_10140, partial [Candidatus Krumholzibacteria bacterium]|nr:hypothetical protein [Candidatus Krumholzibacteria bacterium]